MSIFGKIPHLQPRPWIPPVDMIEFDEARRTNERATSIGMTPTDYVAAQVPQHAAIELKYNGICLCWNDAVGASTLEGVPMPCASHLNPGFAAMQKAAGVRMFFQAEYVVPGGLEATSSAFQRGVPTGFAVVFEAVPLAVWQGQEHSLRLIQRRRVLEELHAIASPSDIGLALHAEGYDAEGVELAAGAAWEGGEEGIIVKNLMSPFVRGRSRFWMKVKRQETVDAPIHSVRTVGEAPFALLHSFEVLVEGKVVKIGRGWPTKLIAQPGEFRVGRMVEFKHNGRTASGAFMSASFLRFRDDKGGSNAP
jgi:hypothetical protein